MGTKDKSSKAQKVKINKMKGKKEKVEELTSKQSERIKGGDRTGTWVVDTTYEKLR